MTTLSAEFDTERAPQIGLIVLQADETIERDMRRLLPETVEALVTRVASGTHVTPESLAAMEGELRSAANLLPAGARLRAVAYGCTSGTAQIGADRVAAAIRAGTRTPHVTEPISAVIAACDHLGIRRLGLLSPYVASVSERLREVLGTAGIEVPAVASFDVDEEARVARIAAASIRSAAVRLAASAEIDALFISCTNLRTLDIIEAVEAEARIPVLTSNQVLAWHLSRLAGLTHGTTTASGALWASRAPS
ncbi:MAG: Asp/Glu racemase [Pseudomonadota bacterium]